MDFFERWFDVSPDHGTGLLEAVYAYGFVTVCAFLASWSFARRRPGQRRRREKFHDDRR